MSSETVKIWALILYKNFAQFLFKMWAYKRKDICYTYYIFYD